MYKSDCPIQETVTCVLKYDTNPIEPGILKLVFLDVKILILSSDRFSYFVVLSVVTDMLEKGKGKGRLWVLQHCCLEAYCTLTQMSSFIHLQRRCTHQVA